MLFKNAKLKYTELKDALNGDSYAREYQVIFDKDMPFVIRFSLYNPSHTSTGYRGQLTKLSTVNDYNKKTGRMNLGRSLHSGSDDVKYEGSGKKSVQVATSYLKEVVKGINKVISNSGFISPPHENFYGGTLMKDISARVKI